MQQINLYLPEFRPATKPVRALHIGWALLGLMVILTLVSYWTSAQTQKLEEQVQTAEQALAQAEDRLGELQIAQAQYVSSDDPVTKLDALKEAVQRRERIRRLMARKELGNVKGFSEPMRALARQTVEGVSIAWFSLQEGGVYAELSGRARAADRVPLYLQRLRTEAAFEETRMGVLTINEAEADTAGLVFSVRRFDPEEALP